MEEPLELCEVFRVFNYINSEGITREEYTHQAVDGYIKRFTDQEPGTAGAMYGIQRLLGVKSRYESGEN